MEKNCNNVRLHKGSSSQQDIEINSSVIDNVTDLKHKIVGLEKQLHNVSRHMSCECCIQESDIFAAEVDDEVEGEVTDDAKEQTEEPSKIKSVSETRVLYKTSDTLYRKSDDSDVPNLNYNHSDTRNDTSEKIIPCDRVNNIKDKKNKNTQNRIFKTIASHQPHQYDNRSKSLYENLASHYSTSSYHSLRDPAYSNQLIQSNYMPHHRTRIHRRSTEYGKTIKLDALKDNNYKEVKSVMTGRQVRKHHNHRYMNPYQYTAEQVRNDDGKYMKKQKHKHNFKRLDQDFIADIIKKQYRPVMFGNRESDISQFSAPICRDQEFRLTENILEGSQLCSCIHDNDHQCNLSDVKSICDARLYSSKRKTRHRINRIHINNYNDSTLYDLVPVKEKSSPKSRRKFVEDNFINEYTREVPPSPRTLRPQLNLRAQYLDNDMAYNHNRRKKREHSRFNGKKDDDHKNTNECFAEIKQRLPQILECNQNNVHRDIGTTSSLRIVRGSNNQINVTRNDNVLNKSQDTCSSDKTDRALSEIKVILQNFLQEIKKESVSQCGQSIIDHKSEDKLSDHREDRTNCNTTAFINNSLGAINNHSMTQSGLPPSYNPSYLNPYYYPVLPMCPMNCVQNGYMVRNPSYTCATCANNENTEAINTQTATNNETEQLIKEIYNFVTQNSKTGEKESCNKNVKTKKRQSRKMMTTRSVGGSSKASRHNAKVGTSKLKCYSKSCEAVGSPLSDTYYTRTNPSYSDTILEKLSFETTESESSATTIETKARESKFAKVLRSFGLSKKKKPDVIEEVTESSSVEVEVKRKSPFRQNITNYMMHEQKYFHPPPMPPHMPHYSHDHRHRHRYEHHHCCGPSYPGYPEPHTYNHMYNSISNPRKLPGSPYHTHGDYTSPHFTNNFNKYDPRQSMPSQVPLCLKEIEVKSMATQSDRKMSFFKKFTKRTPEPDPYLLQNYSAPGTQDKHDFLKTLYMKQQPYQPQHQLRNPQGDDEKPGFWKALYLKQQQKLQEQQQQPGTEEKTGFWKSLHNKQLQQLQQKQKAASYNLDPLKFSMDTQKQLAFGDTKMRNAMLKKLFYKRNPFSPRNLIMKTLLGKDKTSFGDPPTIRKPPMFF